MSLKKFLAHLWQQIKHLWDGIEAETKKLVPIAIHIVQAIKTLEDTHLADVLTAIIPGDIDDHLNQKLREFLPKILLELNMVDAIANITDPNEQLIAIIGKIHLSPDAAKDVFYHGLASLIMQELSDGKFTWSDAIAVAEFYYTHEFKKPQ
jgi:hypothetical protein